MTGVLRRDAAEAERLLTGPGMRFEMDHQVIDGVARRVWKNAPTDLTAVLAHGLSFGDRTFLVFDGQRVSYADHYRAVAKLAHLLVDRFGINKGDRVAIAMRNYPEWSVTFFAVTAVGAVAVPLNAWWTAEELAYGLADSGTALVIADRERAERVLATPRDGGRVPVLVVRAGGRAPEGALSFEDCMAAAPDRPHPPAVDIDPEDSATIFYTSGTTGFPKGALGTHRNICTNILSLGFAPARALIRQGEKLPDPATLPQRAVLLSVPMFHVTGCHSILVAGMFSGGKIVLMYRWDPVAALRLIAEEQVNVFGGVPSMAWQVLEAPEFAEYDTSSIEGVSYGGAPAAPELVETVRGALPAAAPANGWGMTETSSVTTNIVGPEYQAKPNSVGRPVAVCDVKAVDEDGREVARGVLGELMIAGPNVVKGYWNKPAETAEAFVDGWVRTGDIGFIDDEGFVYVVDRAKDVIIRGGENVYCVEVENVLYDHPDVVDAAVIGLPHHVLGEEVGAVVQLKPQSQVTAADLAAHARVHIAAFKVPVAIEVRDAPLPRNANGKILKAVLKEEFERTMA